MCLSKWRTHGGPEQERAKAIPSGEEEANST